MKRLASSALALIVVLMCTACANGYTSSGNPYSPLDNRSSVGVRGSLGGDDGNSITMYGTVDEGVGMTSR